VAKVVSLGGFRHRAGRETTLVEAQKRAVDFDGLSYADALYNLARYLTGSESDAEDLVQETFARAVAKEDQFAPGTNRKAWLFRILRNLFLDRKRRDKIDPTRRGLDEVASQAPARAERDLLRGDAELENLRRVVGAQIETAIMKLPEESRAVILLDLEGFSEAETAEALGIPPGTVKSRLSRARLALRAELAEYKR
jgi:RNA polymerase sigma-70 factor (ECF subfamily)